MRITIDNNDFTNSSKLSTFDKNFF